MRPKCKCEQDPLNRPLGKNQLYKIQSNFLHCNWSALQYTKEHRYVKTKSRCSWYLEESKVSPRSTKGLWAWSLSAPFLCSLLVQGKSSETTMLLQVSLPEGYISIPWFFFLSNFACTNCLAHQKAALKFSNLRKWCTMPWWYRARLRFHAGVFASINSSGGRWLLFFWTSSSHPLPLCKLCSAFHSVCLWS